MVLDGHQLKTIPIGNQASRGPFDVVLPGSLLHPGRNGISIDLAANNPPGLAPIGFDLASSEISLPVRGSMSGLGALPNPFWGGGMAPTTVVLANLGTGTLETAALTAAALGSRAVGPPPDLTVTTADRGVTVAQPGLIVIGTPAADPSGTMTLRRGGNPTLQLHPPAPTGRLSEAPGGEGWIEEARLPGGNGLALWIGGTTPAASARAAESLSSPDVGGRAITVGAGPNFSSAAPQVDLTVPPELVVAYALPVLFAVWLLIIIGLELRARRKRRTLRTRERS